MRKSGVLLALLMSADGAGSAFAADYSVPALKAESYQPPSATPPRFSVVGSVAPTWTNNAFFSRDDRRSDWFFNGDVTVRMDGRFTPDLAYRLYARTEVEPFARERDANISMALWGARLTQNVAGWSASVIYENRHSFAEIYGERLFIANDVKGALSRSFTAGTVILSPFLQGRYRFSGLPEAEYWRFDAALGIEAPLNERWSIIMSRTTGSTGAPRAVTSAAMSVARVHGQARIFSIPTGACPVMVPNPDPPSRGPSLR